MRDSALSKPVIILGGGGHGKVLADALLLLGIEILGIADPALEVGERVGFFGLPVLGGDEVVSRFPPDNVLLANGVGSLPGATSRKVLFERFRHSGYRFATIVHPTALRGREIDLGEGVQVMAGTVLQAGVTIGENSLVNTGAVVDHDCHVGSNVHIAPHATLCGGIMVENDVHIGAGAVVAQYLRIGDGAVLGAGASVARNVEAGATVIPAAVRMHQ